MYVLFTEDKKLLKAHNKVSDKVSNIMQTRFSSEPAYNEKFQQLR